MKDEWGYFEQDWNTRAQAHHARTMLVSTGVLLRARLCVPTNGETPPSATAVWHQIMMCWLLMSLQSLVWDQRLHHAVFCLLASRWQIAKPVGWSLFNRSESRRYEYACFINRKHLIYTSIWLLDQSSTWETEDDVNSFIQLPLVNIGSSQPPYHSHQDLGLSSTLATSGDTTRPRRFLYKKK